VLVCAVIAWRTGGPQRLQEAAVSGTGLFLRVLPNLLLGFALAGFLHVLVPSQLISRWMGDGAGLRGLLAGTVAGMLTPGGPFTHFPLLVWELPILGPQIAFVRVLASAAFPPIIGWLGGRIFRALP
jgi:hypothetical protein